jgi:hypothetical protein
LDARGKIAGFCKSLLAIQFSVDLPVAHPVSWTAALLN